MTPRRALPSAALLLLLVLAAADDASGAVPAAAAAPVAEAWALFQSYHEDLGRIDRAREVLEGAVAREPSVEGLVLLAWVHLAWGDLRARSSEEKLAAYERGRDVAKRAIGLAPRNTEAHFWYAANLGRWAISRGKLRAAFLVSTIREAIETVLQLDPNHVAGLALAGSFYLETPGFLGGDIAKAESYERKALTLDPHFTRARMELAKCLIEERRYAEARRELQQLLDERQPSYVADWTVRHRPTAEQLLARIRNKS